MKKRLVSLLVSIGVIYSVGAQAQTVACLFTPLDGNQFVPSWGAVDSQADQYSRYVWQYMYWHDWSRLTYFQTVETFEPDLFYYNYQGQAYGNAPEGYWDSNLPSPYVDTQFSDPPQEKAVTIGSANATLLSAFVTYYTVTRMSAGGGTFSPFKLQAQRGRRVPDFCYSEWCSFPCDTVNNFRTFPFNFQMTAPGCYTYTWNWWSTTQSRCWS